MRRVPRPRQSCPPGRSGRTRFGAIADRQAEREGRAPQCPAARDQRVISRVEVRTDAASTSGPLTPLVAALMMSRNFTTSTESEFDT